MASLSLLILVFYQSVFGGSATKGLSLNVLFQKLR